MTIWLPTRSRAQPPWDFGKRFNAGDAPVLQDAAGNAIDADAGDELLASKLKLEQRRPK